MPDQFYLGALHGLETFRQEIIANRGLVENETEAAVDVILDLLARCIAELEELGGGD